MLKGFFLTGFAGVKTPDSDLGPETTDDSTSRVKFGDFVRITMNSPSNFTDGIPSKGDDSASRVKFGDFIIVKPGSQNFEEENDEGFLSGGNYNAKSQPKYEYQKPSSAKFENQTQKSYEEEHDEGFLSGGHRKSHL